MPADQDHPDHYAMSFGDHLDELRRRIFLALAVPLPLAIGAFMVTNPLIAWLYKPLDRILTHLDLPRGLQALGPAEFLGMKLKLSIIAALVVSTPWIFWQAWLFVRPGLYGHERRFVHLLVPGSAVLTAAGVVLLYYVMLPLMLQVLIHFGSSIRLPGPDVMADPRVQAILEAEPEVPLRLVAPREPDVGDVWAQWPDLAVYVAVPDDEIGGVEVLRLPRSLGDMISQEFRLTTYLNFVLILMLGMVIAFQLPLVILLLGWLGLITPTELRRRRKYALFICAAVAAIITPADAISMFLMLIPLYGLYELSILLLIFAPASAVAEGRVWRWRRWTRSHKGPDKPASPAQTDRPDDKPGAAYQPPAKRHDDQEGGK